MLKRIPISSDRNKVVACVKIKLKNIKCKKGMSFFNLSKLKSDGVQQKLKKNINNKLLEVQNQSLYIKNN